MSAAAPRSAALPDALPWLADAYEGRCFTADVNPPGAVHVAFVRSPYAHAEIVAIEAPAPADVLGFWTARDLPSHAPIPCIVPIVNRDGTDRADPPHVLMAASRCRHEGEIVAMVAARTQRAANRAAAAVRVTYRVLPAVTDGAAAVEAGAPELWDEAPGNVCFDWELGDAAARDAVLRGAAHVVRRRLRNNRLVIAPLETRSAIAAPVDGTDGFVLVTATQGANWSRDIIARDVLGWDPGRLEVVTPLVGGSFGCKIFVYPEQVLVLMASAALNAAVKWVSTRKEAFLTDVQGRDNHTDATLALDADGRILAITTDTIANLGAHLSNYGPFSSTNCGTPLLCGIYDVGLVHARVRGVFTNTTPMDSYRGAGRPEAHYVLERMIDEAAHELGLDPLALRLRNALDETQLPAVTATGIRLDSGMFRANIRRAQEEADYAGFAHRRAASAAKGLMRGIGMANFLETNGGFALAKIMERHNGSLPLETARIAFTGQGRVHLDIGTQGSGQDHRGAYADMLAARLGMSPEAIEVFQGRSDRLRQGTGTGGSKSMLSGSTAIIETAEAVIARARAWLASRTQRPEAEVVWEDGAFRLDGTPVPLMEAVRMAEFEAADGHPFDAQVTSTIRSGTFGNGCHVCEVEVDPATGMVRVDRYTAVSDFGTIIRMADVVSQQEGGITQGIGQALTEYCRYNADGTLATGDLAAYHLPQVSDIPQMKLVFQGTPCRTNTLGLKGCGEAGISASPPAVMNALHHALRGEVDGMIQMPATPQVVWAALHAEGRR
ncbi:xanthine dehydrogenase family protein molybdopterin-binding subunit [Aquabacter cavernae]|uniref:xanthine dehydrogenase family protein molybdopterin-binding subunit n=1 Tax=Aquabacter cavernae TaxID=2496029 RepID=UPI000F8F161C|nr:xanthine dehydrogenase family protein molybdopterin-binding subunit [Aquabacter cavernae]